MKQNKHGMSDIVLSAETRDRNQTGGITGSPIPAHCAIYIYSFVRIKVLEKLLDCMTLYQDPGSPCHKKDLVYPPHLMMTQTPTKSPTLETEYRGGVWNR
jgi:hypothetical protein